ncbi:amidase [Alteromonas gilva]|uniref:Amidase n=1 Tax=Alteromonas gilva TaxID=2987522 RepID=A0ABT5KYX1_9ALTE|nr:amidase [Alteromonas gilva]MDC8829401.1 amidase [Alteromonas gilva]
MWQKLTGIVLLIGVVSCGTQQPPSIDSKWLDMPAVQQAAAIKNGQISAEELVAGYLARIDALDNQGPNINSILRLNPDAMSDARARDAAIARGEPLGPLHGIPVLLKDNIETNDMPTTAGSLALLNNDTLRDSPLVAQLRAAGAIILGKTNLSEWANFRSEDSISGWSAVGGLTRNPHILSRTACGSSSGSGAAMAAGFASLAVGTETNGSVICPSSMNGIVGFKPTVGLIPRTHIVPISVTQDTAGPMTRSVKDAALMTSVMATTDPSDKATQSASRPSAQTLAALDGDISGLKIGVMRDSQGQDQAIIDAFNDSLAKLTAQGAELVDIESLSLPDDFGKHSYFVLLAEFKSTLNEYLESSPAPLAVRSLQALIDFNAASERELQLFDQSIFAKSQATDGLQDEEYATALQTVRTATRDNGIDKLLKEYDVDVLVAPTNNPAFIIDSVYGDHAPAGFIGIGYLAAIAGYPHITVPMTSVRDLPVGFSIVGGQWQDARVLNVGYAFEKSNKFIKKPGFYPTRFEALKNSALPYRLMQSEQD